MKHVAEIQVYRLDNGFQLKIVVEGKGLLGKLKKENKDYAAESSEKAKLILGDLIDRVEKIKVG